MMEPPPRFRHAGRERLCGKKLVAQVHGHPVIPVVRCHLILREARIIPRIIQ